MKQRILVVRRFSTFPWQYVQLETNTHTKKSSNIPALFVVQGRQKMVHFSSWALEEMKKGVVACAKVRIGKKLEHRLSNYFVDYFLIKN